MKLRLKYTLKIKNLFMNLQKVMVVQEKSKLKFHLLLLILYKLIAMIILLK